MKNRFFLFGDIDLVAEHIANRRFFLFHLLFVAHRGKQTVVGLHCVEEKFQIFSLCAVSSQIPVRIAFRFLDETAAYHEETFRDQQRFVTPEKLLSENEEQFFYETVKELLGPCEKLYVPLPSQEEKDFVAVQQQTIVIDAFLEFLAAEKYKKEIRLLRIEPLERAATVCAALLGDEIVSNSNDSASNALPDIPEAYNHKLRDVLANNNIEMSALLSLVSPDGVKETDYDYATLLVNCIMSSSHCHESLYALTIHLYRTIQYFNRIVDTLFMDLPDSVQFLSTTFN